MPSHPSTPAPTRLTAEDRLDVAEAVGCMMLHVDMRDWEQAKTFLAPEVATDYTSIFGGEPRTCSREELIEGWSSRLPGFDATQHTLTQIRVTGEGDEATALSNVRAAHWIDQRIWAFGGSSIHRLRRTAEGWRIHSIAGRMSYEEGDRAVRAEAIARMAERLGASADALTLIGRSAGQRGT